MNQQRKNRKYNALITAIVMIALLVAMIPVSVSAAGGLTMSTVYTGMSAKAGDTVTLRGKTITVKTIHRWNPKIKAYIVANADNSGKFSDLPNFNVINEVASVTVKDDKILEVTLKKPLTEALAAGTSIRLHVGGAMHVCSKPVIAGKEWSSFSHVIGGYSKGHTQTNFRHGAKYAKIFLLHPRGTTLEFRNITLKELPAENK